MGRQLKDAAQHARRAPAPRHPSCSPLILPLLSPAKAPRQRYLASPTSHAHTHPHPRSPTLGEAGAGANDCGLALVVVAARLSGAAVLGEPVVAAGAGLAQLQNLAGPLASLGLRGRERERGSSAVCGLAEGRWGRVKPPAARSLEGGEPTVQQSFAGRQAGRL